MKNLIHYFHWIPRVLCICAILFVSLFAADAFAPELTLWQQLSDFMIHLIPSFILIALLIIAWHWEFAGGILFMLIGIGFTPPIFMLNYRRTQSIIEPVEVIVLITFPFIVAGILFLISHNLRKKNQRNG